MRRALVVVEVGLYLLFVADCLLLVVSVAHTATWAPEGGAALIPIALLGALVRRLRNGPDDY